MIGKVLKGRYQIVQVLSAGAFGQTYIAEDQSQPDSPKCVIKHIKTPSLEPNYLEMTRRRFMTETEVLKQLGKHDQIPQLIDCFHKAEEFCLVQELIEGHSLSEELPLRRNTDNILSFAPRPYEKRWTESQVIALLQELLRILEFVHSQGFIHCDLKPDNILRRDLDGKLFLIDFGAVQRVRQHEEKRWIPTQTQLKTTIGISPLGYLPAEQLTGHPHPNSDLYALALIAIQALTGIEPAQLNINADTGEVVWQHLCKGTAGVPGVSFQLAFVLNRMLRYDFQERYQSAAEALQALQQLSINRQLSAILGPPPTVPAPSAVISEEQSTSSEENSPKMPLFLPQRLPLLTGLGVCMAANTLVIMFGLYSLLHTSPSESEADLLRAAQEEYQTGDIEKAIKLAQSIPKNSSIYPEAQAAMQEWRQEWKTATHQFQAVEVATNEGRWIDALEEARKVPEISYWQQKVEPLVQQAQPKIEEEARQLLEQAYEYAAQKDFATALDYLQHIPSYTSVGSLAEAKLREYTEKQHIQADRLLQQAYERAAQKDFAGALEYLQQIPQNTPAGGIAEQKLEEYAQKQQIRAESLLQKAFERAAEEDFTRALKYLEQIPQDTPIYDQAQSLIQEYTEMQHRQLENQEVVPSTFTPSTQLNEPLPTKEKVGALLDLNPGSHLQEIIG